MGACAVCCPCGCVHQAQVAHVRDPFGVRSQARVVVIVIRRALEAIAVLEESAAHRAGRPGRRRADRGSTGVRGKTEARTRSAGASAEVRSQGATMSAAAAAASTEGAAYARRR